MKVKAQMILPLAAVFFAFGFVLFHSCKKETKTETRPDVWDIDKSGIPKFSVIYTNLARISKISRFRSGIGHDYSDFVEHCRSMKHYFYPADTTDWSKVEIFAPVSGTLTRVEQEGFGFKYEIQSSDYPAFRFVIFHLNPSQSRQPGDKVTEYEKLGNHIGSSTFSDIAVIVNDPTRQGRMVSYFLTLTDEAFQLFKSRGISGRDSFIISREQRDASPLICNGDQFAGEGSLENWVILQ